MSFNSKFLSKKSKSMLTILMAIPVLAMSYTNCMKEKLVPLSNADIGVYDYGSVKAQFCTSLPTPGKQNIKYLFIIDHSALNKPGLRMISTDTTNADPNGSRRYGPLVNFVQGLTPAGSTTVSYDIIDFADAAQQASGLSTFDDDAADFAQIATNDWVGTGTVAAPSPRDSGFTNYQYALNAALSLIQNDLQQASTVPLADSVATTYQIVFVSGGQPVVPAVANDGSLYIQQFASDLKPVIDQIVALKNDTTYGPYVSNISFNTAYYFAPTDSADPAAVTLLQSMANEGNGLFVNFGGGQQISYEQFAPAETNLKNELADVFVENENAVWWNGQFMLDSDGDGLPDEIERQLGSNPFKADSDGNGVSDFVEYKTKGAPCLVNGCAATGRDAYAICSGFNPVSDANGAVTFSSSTNDGLNDCEKFVLGASYRTFNSSGSLIPDFYALKNNISVGSGVPDVAMKDPFGDGVTNYYKLKLGLPVTSSTKALSDYIQRSTNLVVASTPSVVQTCYNLEVDNVALTAPGNKIRVHLVQNKAVIQDDATSMTAEAQMGGGLSVNFTPSDFH